MNLTQSMGIFRRLTLLALGLMVALSVSRIILMLIHWGRVAETGGGSFILLQGVRYDLILLGMLIVLAEGSAIAPFIYTIF